MLLLASGLGVPTAHAATPETCGSSDLCYAGYSAKGLKTIAEDLSANGEESRYYKTMMTAMDADTRGTLKVTSTAIADNGKQVDMQVRLIGVLHDNKADGTGKAGLTFQTVNALPRSYCFAGVMPDADPGSCKGGNISGGWRDSALRGLMDSGEIWESMPSALRDNVEPVVKMSDNDRSSGGAVATGTVDRLFTLSYRELVETVYDGWASTPFIGQEGTQYGFYKGRVTDNHGVNEILDSLTQSPSGKDYGDGWTRSLHPAGTGRVIHVGSFGIQAWMDITPEYRYGIAPAFCL